MIWDEGWEEQDPLLHRERDEDDMRDDALDDFEDAEDRMNTAALLARREWMDR